MNASSTSQTVRPRKIVLLRETLHAEMDARADRPVVRVVGVAVVPNPFAGRHVEDISALFDLGGALGDQLVEQLMPMLERPVVSYGKAAIVGTAGEFEHGGGLLHPKLGRPMRGAIGGGKAVIPSNVKVAPAGTVIDIPLGHKDEPWSFDHFDTISVAIPDAPRPDELMMCVALADGGRLFPRCGDAPITD